MYMQFTQNGKDYINYIGDERQLIYLANFLNFEHGKKVPFIKTEDDAIAFLNTIGKVEKCKFF